MEILRKVYFFLLDTVQTLLLAAAIFVVTYIFLFRPYQVSGLSMYPTFHDKEYVLTNLIALRFNPLQKGDVIVFHSPTSEDKDFIKRIIGLPGDTVMIKDGEVYLNNTLLDQSGFLASDVKTYGGSYMREGVPTTVPPEHYFVMGDNRPHSSDSREFGPIKKEAVIGKSTLVYWPPDRMRMVEHTFK